MCFPPLPFSSPLHADDVDMSHLQVVYQLVLGDPWKKCLCCHPSMCGVVHEFMMLQGSTWGSDPP